MFAATHWKVFQINSVYFQFQFYRGNSCQPLFYLGWGQRSYVLWLSVSVCMHACMHMYVHTHTRLTALCPGPPGWARTRKVKTIWILLKQETVSVSGISWAICESAPRSRQITTPAPHRSVFYRPDALPAAQPTVSKHWRHMHMYVHVCVYVG